MKASEVNYILCICMYACRLYTQGCLKYLESNMSDSEWVTVPFVHAFCLLDGPFSLPYVNNQNPVRPVVAKCNLAVLLSLKNASGLVVQKGNMC